MGHKTKSPSKSHVASKSLGAPKVNDENAPSKANKKSKSAPKLLKDAVKADSSDSSDSDSDSSSSSSSSDSDSSSSSSSSSSSDSSDSESEAETKKSSKNAAAKKTPAPAESDSDSSSSSDSDSSSDEEEAPAKSKKTPAPLPTEDAGSESDDESSDSSDSDSSDSDDDKKKAKKEGKSVLGKRSSSSDSDSSSSSSSDSSDSDSSDSDDEPRTKKSKSSHTPSEDVPEVEVDVKPTPVENREPIVESQADAFQNARKRGREWSGENQGGDFGNKRPREGRADTDAVSVFMGRLPREGVEEHDIQGWFEEADLSVVQVRMIRDRETREFKGACFVQFNDEESMKKACAFDGERFFGRPVRINAASKRPGEGGAGGAPGGRPQRGPPGTVLFVGNIPWSAGENELRSHFGDAGVTNIHMPLNDWGKPKGFALVSFPDTESCSAAEKKFAGSMLADRELRIEVSGGGGGGGDRRGSFGGGDRRGGFGGGDRRGGFGGGDRAPRGGLGFGKSQPKAFQGEKKTFAGSDSD